MRIAQFSPIDESVPPETYGGTEWVVHYLTEELVKMGHRITLFAAGDSRTSAELVPVAPRSLRLAKQYLSRHAYLAAGLETLYRRRADFDLVHFHIDYVHLPLVRHVGIPCVTTLHGRQDLPGLPELYKEFSEMPLVSISNAQRRPLPVARWAGTVYHGLPSDLYKFSMQKGSYLAFLGRVSEEKGIIDAIEISKRSGIPLKIAAKIDVDNKDFFYANVSKLLDHPLIEFIGEIGEAQKSEFLGGALALLFPISWPEPFGLVMIESMACGTPVIAYKCGSVPEIIDNGRTGFIVSGLEEALDVLPRVQHLSGAMCRHTFERRFTSRLMARDYLNVYEQVLASQSAPFYRKKAIM
jgi:glycosyltransferase involved in cell wall biosynthesis